MFVVVVVVSGGGRGGDDDDGNDDDGVKRFFTKAISHSVRGGEWIAEILLRENGKRESNWTWCPNCRMASH